MKKAFLAALALVVSAGLAVPAGAGQATPLQPMHHDSHTLLSKSKGSHRTKSVHVRSYKTKKGTKVKAHNRRPPSH